MDISAKEMNCVYTKLKTPLSEDMIDYNYYVDEILQMSPPYSETKDRENEETEASSRFFPHGKKQQVYDAS